MKSTHQYSLDSTGALFGAIAASTATGFSYYLAASSGLAVFARGLGLTFATTTFSSLSQALGAVFGPVGLGVSGALAAYNFLQARPRKAIPLVLYIALHRGAIQMQSKKRLSMWVRLRVWLRIRKQT